MKKTISLILTIALCFGIVALSGCGGNEKAAPELVDAAIIHETEFGGVYIDITIDDFNALGFEYGDSLKLSFSNGYTLDDLPYYNGYYTQVGEPLLVAYPGYPHIRAGINNGGDLWEIAELTESETATITLAEKGKYADIQSARDIHYEDDRALFESDEVFANFRSVKVGRLRENMLFRSASPCDNQHNRAPYVDKLIKKAKVKLIVDLADTDEKIADYMVAGDFDSPYFASLYKEKKVCPLSMNMNFGSDEFKKKAAQGLAFIAENEGSFLVHCTEGKDRTGFICMLIEALAGANYDEILADYMVTYYNYYKISAESDSARYNTIVENVLVPMIEAMVGDDSVDVKTADLAPYAEQFAKDGGMTDEQIKLLKEKITE